MIVGTSFIGMEVAAYLVDKAASVTVVGRSSTPFAHVFGNWQMSAGLLFFRSTNFKVFKSVCEERI